MAILVTEDTKLCVSGITGREGTFHAMNNRRYGTQVVSGDRTVAALDAKVTLDDNSLFRHPDNASLRNTAAEDEQEQMARERGLTFVKLDGN